MKPHTILGACYGWFKAKRVDRRERGDRGVGIKRHGVHEGISLWLDVVSVGTLCLPGRPVLTELSPESRISGRLFLSLSWSVTQGWLLLPRQNKWGASLKNLTRESMFNKCFLFEWQLQQDLGLLCWKHPGFSSSYILDDWATFLTDSFFCVFHIKISITWNINSGLRALAFHWLSHWFFLFFFYILLITFKAFRDQALNYIRKQLTTYDPWLPLRSADVGFLIFPRDRLVTEGINTDIRK